MTKKQNERRLITELIVSEDDCLRIPSFSDLDLDEIIRTFTTIKKQHGSRFPKITVSLSPQRGYNTLEEIHIYASGYRLETDVELKTRIEESKLGKRQQQSGIREREKNAREEGLRMYRKLKKEFED